MGNPSPVQEFKHSVNFNLFSLALPPLLSLLWLCVWGGLIVSLWPAREGGLWVFWQPQYHPLSCHGHLVVIHRSHWWLWLVALLYHILVCVSIMGNTFWTANQFSVLVTTATTTVLCWLCTKSTNTWCEKMSLGFSWCVSARARVRKGKLVEVKGVHVLL